MLRIEWVLLVDPPPYPRIIEPVTFDDFTRERNNTVYRFPFSIFTRLHEPFLAPKIRRESTRALLGAVNSRIVEFRVQFS